MRSEVPFSEARDKMSTLTEHYSQESNLKLFNGFQQSCHWATVVGSAFGGHFVAILRQQ